MTRSVLPVEEILEALDLSRAEPGLGFLEALFSRFISRVPFENATKILRHAAQSEAAQKPRRPETFWQEHLASGAGGTCFARVAAFGELLADLGFSVVRALGRVGTDDDHAALFVERDNRLLLCDVGFPLPAVLPAAAGEYPTERGTLTIEATQRGLAIDFADGVAEGPRRIEVFSEAVTDEEFEQRWRATFRPEAHFLSAVKLRVERGARTISFAQGEMRVDDRHSRLTVPLPGPRPRRLAEIFEMDEELLAGAFAIVGDPDPPAGAGTLAARLETVASPEAAFSAIASPAGYRELLGGVAHVTSEEATPEGFRLRLAAPEGAPQEAGLEEDVAVDDAGRRLTVRRRGASSTFRSCFRVETSEGRTYLLREALFDSPREDLLRNDALRGRLAGSLAVDLLAWARRI